MNRFTALAGVAMLALGGVAVAQAPAQTSPTDRTAGQSVPSTPDSAVSPGANPDSSMAPAAGDTSMAPTTATDSGMSSTTAQTAPDASTAPASTDMSQSAQTAPTTGAPTQTASADATSKVQADWSKYDKGNKGSLTPLEFGNWIMAANGQDMTAQVDATKTSKKPNLPAVKVLNATASAFEKADTDKSRSVSPDELATYLSNPA